MENFSLYLPTFYEFGRGSVDKVGSLTTAMGCSRVLIVYGRAHAKTSGLIDRVESALRHSAIEYEELGGVQPNPVDTLVRQGIALARDRHIEGIIAVGGGSVIDTAKAIAAGVPYEGDFWDFYGGGKTITEALPVGVVLTIAAAGSEGSGNSVITNVATRQKLGARTASILRPRFSIIDPALTVSLPPYHTACGITDMMAHILERYFSPTADVEVTDRLAEGLLMAIIDEAPKVMASPDNYQARANITWASTMAHNGILGCGRVEDWTSHAMEHEISALYDVAHGAGLAVVVPAWLTFMVDHKPAKVAQLGRRIFAIDIADDRLAAIETVARLKAFFKVVLGMPSTFAELGIAEPDIDAMVRGLHKVKGEMVGGYYKLNSSDTRSIYRMML